MKWLTEERKQRLSLTLLFSLTVLVFLVLTSVIVATIIGNLVYRGTLQLGDRKLDPGLFIRDMFLWSTVIGLLFTFAASHIPLKPVHKVLDMIHRVASGDYSVRLSYNGPLSQLPAVSEMTKSLNAMAAELEQTEILRNDFINNFSHEFKTPIVSIAGFAKMLKRGDLSEQQQREYLDIIEKESLRLAQMSSSVLDLTKVESQTILTDIQTFDLTEQIRTCVLMLEGKWTRKHIELTLPEEEYEVKGCMELLKLAWINLLDNAVKFSSDYAPVDVSIHQNNEGTIVRVSNYCDDIPKDKLAKIFSKFYQADESHATEGNGVGLAIVKKVVDLHGGSVNVTSEDGKTVFSVFLPAG